MERIRIGCLMCISSVGICAIRVGNLLCSRDKLIHSVPPPLPMFHVTCSSLVYKHLTSYFIIQTFFSFFRHIREHRLALTLWHSSLCFCYGVEKSESSSDNVTTSSETKRMEAKLSAAKKKLKNSELKIYGKSFHSASSLGYGLPFSLLSPLFYTHV